MWRCLQDQLAKGATCHLSKTKQKMVSGWDAPPPSPSHHQEYYKWIPTAIPVSPTSLLNMILASNISKKKVEHIFALHCTSFLSLPAGTIVGTYLPKHPSRAQSKIPTSAQWRFFLSGALGKQSTRNAGGTRNLKSFWLVVSTHLKKISQIGNLPQIGVKI